MGILNNIFGKKDNDSKDNGLNWNHLESLEDLKKALEYSFTQPIIILKHSTRCSISSSALSRLERKWSGEEINLKAYYLDLLNHRDVSAEIANQLKVVHQSPQIILVKDGVAVYSATHMDIDFEELKDYAPAN